MVALSASDTPDAPQDSDGPATDNPEQPRAAHRPLTVLQVLPRLDLGGVERGAVEIARAITAAGGRALVASEGGRLAARLLACGAEPVTAPMASKNPLVMAANVRRLAKLIRDERVDIVHARSRAPAWSAWLAARQTGCAFVTTWHGAHRAKGPIKKLYNSVMGFGRPVIAISEFIAEMATGTYGVPPEQIVTIPRGADINAFAEEVVSAERTITIARDWGIVEDPRPVILLPGRLSPWKGQADLIEAAARLKARRGPVFLALIVGEDGGRIGERLLARARDLDILDVVKVLPATEDMPAAYKLAAVVLSASTEPEAFGRVAVEAQAMGRPVIATDHGGARETVDPGRTGWLYPPGDIDALTEAMDAALSLEPWQRAHMGMAGRARVANRFTVEAMQRATLAVYEQAAGRTFGVTV
jgi:glycosyltransferase involved in cell wall biosynthesis